MTYILGINAFHGDSSACLIQDGVLIAAAEEERFRRVKHWAGFPSKSIMYCLNEAGIRLENIDHIAINQESNANLIEKITYVLTKLPKFEKVLGRLINRKARNNLFKILDNEFPNDEFNGRFHYIEHHMAHMSSAFHVSPYKKAVVVSVDGFGDFASAAWGIGENNKISIDKKIFYPHSLGIFYQALTQFIGFLNYGDEYKVMGLAPYGQPLYINEMRQIVNLLPNGEFRLNLNYFRHHNENVSYTWNGGTPTVGLLYSEKMKELLGAPRASKQELTQKHMDIARSVQVMYEEALFNLLNKIYDKYDLKELTLAGGCAMNSVANGKILNKTKFKKVYIQSAAGDAGGAIGAAYSTWHNLGGNRVHIHDHAYWGPHYNNQQIYDYILERKKDLNATEFLIEKIEDDTILFSSIASAISQGDVVGWFQGRMEWGPRALGNRSILGDPRRADMKDILNLKIKRRESFRPFAPSVLNSEVDAWFEEKEDVPFMMQVYQIRKDKHSLIPAVTHVDGSGRLQSVNIHTNPKYHALISAFKEITGIPMVLNTSFNENEPVVCTPAEALDCFIRTKMDILVMENWIVKRVT